MKLYCKYLLINQVMEKNVEVSLMVLYNFAKQLHLNICSIINKIGE